MSDHSNISRRAALIAATSLASFAATSPAEESTRDGIDVAAEKMNVYPIKPLLTVSVTSANGQSIQLKATEVRVTYLDGQALLVNRDGVVTKPEIEHKVAVHKPPIT